MAKKNIKVSKKTVGRKVVGRKAREPNVVKRHRTSTTYKDVVIAYAMSGLTEVKKLHNTGILSKVIVGRALKEFTARGMKASDLTLWAEDTFGEMTTQARGRSAPVNGKMRRYKAQQIGNKPLFLRVPLTTFGVSKGDGINVAFADGTITLSRAG